MIRIAVSARAYRAIKPLFPAWTFSLGAIFQRGPLLMAGFADEPLELVMGDDKLDVGLGQAGILCRMKYDDRLAFIGRVCPSSWKARAGSGMPEGSNRSRGARASRGR